ncbi:hypothetical protein SAMN02745216_05103 [Desulfatibacillum alkenivorans DSM 16219]|uniref:DUF1573 domain-containing protein n=2 Tax=Desulfatibacillum alkenivorans TaxID=259354 RepID=A0A1M7A6A4_9BACT|nr:hypothetical protein SAMN02745216_05103 [Desulfatibacillum alkenivorans DSM 16219]
MKAAGLLTKIFVCAAMVSFLCGAPLWAAEGEADVPAVGPSITFASTEYQFESVLEGDLITHQYIFKNTGTQNLEIKQVKVG